MLGTAATPTLLRRATEQTASQISWSEPLVMVRNGLDYEYRNEKALGVLHGLERDHRRSSEAGSDAHLVKPSSYEELTRILSRGRGGD